MTIQDSLGNTIVGSSASITVAIGANPGNGTLTGSTSLTASRGVASFANLSINQVGNGYTLTASSNGLAAAGSASFSIRPGAAFGLVATGPSSAIAGATQTVTVTATDLSGNAVTAYTGTVHFTSSDAQASLPGDYTFVAGDNGTHTFTSGVTMETAGSQTVSATDTGNGSITGATPPITVSAAAAGGLSVVASTGAVTAGVSMGVSVTAQDQYGNTVSGYTGTVHFTSSDAQAGLPGDYTFVAGDNGAHTFTGAVTLRTAGSQTVTAVDTVTSSITDTSDPIVVSAAAASRLAVVASTGAVMAGVPLSVSVTAQDQYGNIVTGYAGSIHFTSTDAQASLPVNYSFVASDNGTHLFGNSVTLKTAGSKTLTATATGTGGISGTTTPIVVSAVAVSRLAVVASPSAVTAGIAQSVTVTAQDQYGSTVTGYTGTVHFTSSDAQASLPGDYTFVAGDNGSHIFSGAVTLKTAGSWTLSATDTVTGGITGTSAPVAVSAAAAKVLVFNQQPSNTVAGSPISPALTVQVQDSFGNTITSSTASIKMVIGTNAGAGTLSGTTTVKAVKGVASFSNLSINKTGTGYTFKPTSTGLTTPTSASFNITPGAALRLAFTVQPKSAAAGVSIAPAVQVKVQDGNSNTIPSSAATITVTIGANPGSGTLAGTATVSAVSGVATFSNLAINRPGTAYTLVASSSGLTSATSTAFNITVGAANRLAISSQPSTSVAGVSISPSVQVTVQDSQGNTVSSSTLSISMAIGTNAGGGTLGGTTAVSAVSGVATFSTLSINKVGTGYTLTAARSGLTSATSTSFNITVGTPSQLTFTAQPTNEAAGASISPTIQVSVQDAFGNTVTSSTASIAIVLGANPGGGTLSGTATVTAVNGVAAFDTLSLDRTGAGYTLGASGGGLTGATSTAFTITPGSASQLAFTSQPSNAVAGVSISPSIKVTVQDALANTVTSSTVPVTIAFGTNSGAGTLSGTATVNAVSGVATFSNLSINRTGSGYTLATSSSGLSGDTSTAFTITAGTARPADLHDSAKQCSGWCEHQSGRPGIGPGCARQHGDQQHGFDCDGDWNQPWEQYAERYGHGERRQWGGHLQQSLSQQAWLRLHTQGFEQRADDRHQHDLQRHIAS